MEFTEHGYAGDGVRQIAERAGVTAMRINRYFGSKEGLFAQAVDRAFAPPTVVGDERRSAHRSVRRRGLLGEMISVEKAQWLARSS